MCCSVLLALCLQPPAKMENRETNLKQKGLKGWSQLTGTLVTYLLRVMSEVSVLFVICGKYKQDSKFIYG